MNVFFSYSHRDALDARRLCRALGVHFPATWLDVDHLNPGDDLDPVILGKIEKCQAAVICFGPNDLGHYQKTVEINALLAARERGVRLVVAILPGCTKMQLDLLDRPPFQGLLYQQFEHTVEDQQAISAVCRALSTGEGANQPLKSRSLSADTSRLGLIAESVRANGAVAIVGATWGHQASDLPNCDPDEFDLPFELDGHETRELGHGLRAHLHEIAWNRDMLEHAFRTDTRYWNWAPLDVHAALARWTKASMPVHALHRSDTERRPLIIATTALDIRIERALIAARTPFVRFVIDQNGTMVRTQIDSYTRSTTAAGTVDELRSETKAAPLQRRNLAALRELSRGDGSASEAARAALRDHESDFELMSQALGEQGYAVPRQDEWWEYCEDERALSYFSSEFHRSSDPPKIQPATHVMLLKLNGTIERRASWRLRYTDLLAWPSMPPWLEDMLQGALGNSEVLIFGYRLVDAEFLHVHATLLEPQRKSRKHRMICPVDQSSAGITATFDRKYEAQVDAAARELGLEPYRQTSAAEMLTQLASRAIERFEASTGFAAAKPAGGPTPAAAGAPASPVRPAAEPQPAMPRAESPPALSSGDVWVA